MCFSPFNHPLERLGLPSLDFPGSDVATRKSKPKKHVSERLRRLWHLGCVCIYVSKLDSRNVLKNGNLIGRDIVEVDIYICNPSERPQSRRLDQNSAS